MIRFMLRLIVVCLFALSASRQTFAVEESPLMAKIGKLLFSDDFAGTEPGPKWTGGRLGEWTVKDGILNCAARPGDRHDPYLYVSPDFEFKDVVVEFGFKFASSKQIDLCMRDTNSTEQVQGGHVLRASLRPDFVQVVDLREGIMKWENYRIRKDPKSTRAEQKAVADKVRDKFGNFKVQVDATAWHQVRVEIIGHEILMSLDGKPVAYLKSSGIAHPTKNQIGFSCGSSASFKPLTMWAATASPEWNAKRDAVLQSLPEVTDSHRPSRTHV